MPSVSAALSLLKEGQQMVCLASSDRVEWYWNCTDGRFGKLSAPPNWGLHCSPVLTSTHNCSLSSLLPTHTQQTIDSRLTETLEQRASSLAFNGSLVWVLLKNSGQLCRVSEQIHLHLWQVCPIAANLSTNMYWRRSLPLIRRQSGVLLSTLGWNDKQLESRALAKGWALICQRLSGSEWSIKVNFSQMARLSKAVFNSW